MKEYRDYYFRKAKQENYPARSVYKLQEMDRAFRLFRPGMKVLDLGAAPGSWSLYAAERVGEKGRVLACDLQETDTVFPPCVLFLQEDVIERSPAFEELLRQSGPFDVVMSRFTDQARSLELCLEALAVADAHLKTGGTFIAKIFMGPDFQDLAGAVRQRYAAAKTFKPKSSRAESKEIFEVGMGFRGPAQG